MSGDRLRVDPILCDAHGQCAELLPELITVDEWGYPIVDDRPIPADLRRNAQRAITMCPRLALSRDRARRATGR
jgi:ferredoxin